MGGKEAPVCNPTYKRLIAIGRTDAVMNTNLLFIVSIASYAEQTHAYLRPWDSPAHTWHHCAVRRVLLHSNCHFTYIPTSSRGDRFVIGVRFVTMFWERKSASLSLVRVWELRKRQWPSPSQAGAGAPCWILTHDMRAAAALSVPNCVLNVPNNRGYFYFYECHEFYFSYIGRIQLQHMRHETDETLSKSLVFNSDLRKNKRKSEQVPRGQFRAQLEANRGEMMQWVQMLIVT